MGYQFDENGDIALQIKSVEWCEENCRSDRNIYWRHQPYTKIKKVWAGKVIIVRREVTMFDLIEDFFIEEVVTEQYPEYFI